MSLLDEPFLFAPLKSKGSIGRSFLSLYPTPFSRRCIHTLRWRLTTAVFNLTGRDILWGRGENCESWRVMLMQMLRRSGRCERMSDRR
jgi:hypothetical protein